MRGEGAWNLTEMPSPTISWKWAALAAAWLAVVGGGLGILWDYEAQPGSASPAPVRWPEGGQLDQPRAGLRLLLFLHPRCPCSRATVAELARLLAHCQGRLTAEVFFYRPTDRQEAWSETDLWASAAAIPDVHVSWDEGGATARRFGARTSGYVLVYDAAGALRFSGGITPSRGHEGDNPGRDAIVALAAGEGAPQTSFPVFGCSLEAPCDLHPEDRP